MTTSDVAVPRVVQRGGWERWGGGDVGGVDLAAQDVVREDFGDEVGKVCPGAVGQHARLSQCLDGVIAGCEEGDIGHVGDLAGDTWVALQESSQRTEVAVASDERRQVHHRRVRLLRRGSDNCQSSRGNRLGVHDCCGGWRF